MNEPKIQKYEQKSKNSGVFAFLSFVGTIAGIVLSCVYSDKAETERRKDPIYLEEVRRKEEERRQLAMKQAEADKQRYILEQEKLKVDAENRKLDKEREKKTEMLEEIKDIQDQADDMEDFELIDSAYTLLDILKKGKIDDQIKYRALACISELKRNVDGRKAEQKLDEIAAQIERL